MKHDNQDRKTDCQFWAAAFQIWNRRDIYIRFGDLLNKYERDESSFQISESLDL